MYRIEFYEKRNGTSDVWDFLEELREKSKTNKGNKIAEQDHKISGR